MKIKVFSLIVAVMMIATVAYGKIDGARVAVLPFQINSDQDLGFLRNGIQDMLGSRLSWDDKVKVIDKEAVNAADAAISNFTGKSRALLAGGTLQADYVVYGSLTMIGSSASIDAKVVDVAGKSEPVAFFKQAETLGDVIPQINQFATDINTTVFKRPLPKAFEAPVAANTNQYSSPNQGFLISSQRIPMMGAQQGQGMTFWRSADINDLLIGMAFGDVNNDGKRDLVYITDHEVRITRLVQGRLAPATVAVQKKFNKFIAVDVADINDNGTPEIFVSGIAEKDTQVRSFVLEFDGSGYKEIVNHSPYMFRVTQGEHDKPVLLGQKALQKPVSERGGLFGTPVYKMMSTGQEYVSGDMLLKGKIANVLGVALGKVEDNGGVSTIAFDNKDYIHLFNGTGRSDWTGVDKLGGNIDKFVILPVKKDDDPDYQYFPTRIRVFDTDRDGKPEVITSVNYDRALNLVQGFRSFSKGRMQALAWDSLGLQPIWESRHLSGRISDFFIEDFDDDGTMELVISLVKKEKGALMAIGAESMIVAFDLSPVKK